MVGNGDSRKDETVPAERPNPSPLVVSLTIAVEQITTLRGGCKSYWSITQNENSL